MALLAGIALAKQGASRANRAVSSESSIGRYQVIAAKSCVDPRRRGGSVELLVKLDTVTGKTWVLTSRPTAGEPQLRWEPIGEWEWTEQKPRTHQPMEGAYSILMRGGKEYEVRLLHTDGDQYRLTSGENISFKGLYQFDGKRLVLVHPGSGLADMVWILEEDGHFAAKEGPYRGAQLRRSETAH